MNDPNDPPEPGRSQRRTSRRASAASFSAARGAALIAVAIIVGVVLLNAIDDGNNGPVGDGGASSSTTSRAKSDSTTTTTVVKGTGGTTATTKPVPIPPALVTVLVLNASGRTGVASTLTNTLKAKGYKTLAASNAPVRAGTVVDVKPGKTAPCTTLATLVPGAKVQPMPSPPPFVTDADCIVVIGS